MSDDVERSDGGRLPPSGRNTEVSNQHCSYSRDGRLRLAATSDPKTSDAPNEFTVTHKRLLRGNDALWLVVFGRDLDAMLIRTRALISGKRFRRECLRQTGRDFAPPLESWWRVANEAMRPLREGTLR